MMVTAARAGVATRAFGSQRRLMSRGTVDADGYLVHHAGAPVWELLHLRGQLDLSVLAAAVTLLTSAIDSFHLRLRNAASGPPVVEWRDPEPLALEVHRAATLFSDGRLDTRTVAQVRPLLFTHPNLRTGPLARFAVVSAGEDDHLLAISIDHIIADGWSLGLLQRRLARCYRALLRGDADAGARAVSGTTFRAFLESVPPEADQTDDWSALLAEHPLPGPVFRPPGGMAKEPGQCRIDNAMAVDLPAAARSHLDTVAATLAVTGPQLLAAVTCALATLWSDGPQPIFQHRHGRYRRPDISVIGPLVEVCLGLPPAQDLPIGAWLADYLDRNPVRPLYGRSLWDTGRFAPRYVGFNVAPPARAMRFTADIEAVPVSGDALDPIWAEGIGSFQSYAALWVHYYLDEAETLRLLVKYDTQLLPRPEAAAEAVAAILAAAASSDQPTLAELRTALYG
jgi:hypothetical protein